MSDDKKERITTGIGICLGLAFGAIFGLLFDNLALGLGIGSAVGLAIGLGKWTKEYYIPRLSMVSGP